MNWTGKKNENSRNSLNQHKQKSGIPGDSLQQSISRRITEFSYHTVVNLLHRTELDSTIVNFIVFDVTQSNKSSAIICFDEVKPNSSFTFRYQLTRNLVCKLTLFNK